MNMPKPKDPTLKLDLVNLSGLGRAIRPVIDEDGGSCGTSSCGCGSGGSCGTSSCGCG